MAIGGETDACRHASLPVKAECPTDRRFVVATGTEAVAASTPLVAWVWVELLAKYPELTRATPTRRMAPRSRLSRRPDASGSPLSTPAAQPRLLAWG
jgi:hypothetical protein